MSLGSEEIGRLVADWLAQRRRRSMPPGKRGGSTAVDLVLERREEMEALGAGGAAWRDAEGRR